LILMRIFNGIMRAVLTNDVPRKNKSIYNNSEM
jgi:hypothetical protein